MQKVLHVVDLSVPSAHDTIGCIGGDGGGGSGGGSGGGGDGRGGNGGGGEGDGGRGVGGDGSVIGQRWPQSWQSKPSVHALEATPDEPEPPSSQMPLRPCEYRPDSSELHRSLQVHPGVMTGGGLGLGGGVNGEMGGDGGLFATLIVTCG